MQNLMRNKGKKFEWNEEAQEHKAGTVGSASARHAYREGHVSS